MRHPGRWIAAALLFLPGGGWAYRRFVYYPHPVERHQHGPYEVIVYAEPAPTDRPVRLFAEIPLIVGDIHNNTQIRIELRRGGTVLRSEILLSGMDALEDHVPVAVEWDAEYVQVKEPRYGESVRSAL